MIKMCNVVLTINSKDGFSADIVRKEMGKSYVRLFIIVNKRSSIKYIKDNILKNFQEFYDKYIKTFKYNFRKDKIYGAVIEHNPWIIVRNEDLMFAIRKIIKIFRS